MADFNMDYMNSLPSIREAGIKWERDNIAKSGLSPYGKFLRMFSTAMLLMVALVGCNTPPKPQPGPPPPPPAPVKAATKRLSAILVTTAPQVASDRIAVSASGLHAFAWSPTMCPPNYVTFFRDANDVTDVLLPGSDYPFIKPEIAFCGTSLIIADCSGGVGPAWAGRYSFDGTNLTLLDKIGYGNVNTRTGCSAQLANGFCAVNYCTFGLNQPLIAFDVLAWSSKLGWRTNRFTIPNSTPGSLAAEMDAVEMDGRVYAFYCLDSSGQIGLLVFDVSGPTIAMTMSNPAFIGRDAGLAAPSLEIPLINACKDPYQDRLILAYQNAQSTYQTKCVSPAGLRISGPATITAVYPDLSFAALAVMPWDYMHDDADMIACWPQPDGIHVYNSRADTNANCVITWRTALVTPSGGVVFNPAQDDPNGDLMSFSTDGYIVTDPYRLIRKVIPAVKPIVWNGPDGQFTITNLTIFNGSVTVGWSGGAKTNQVQWKSPASKTWVNFGGPTTANSVTQPQPATSALFRIKRFP